MLPMKQQDVSEKDTVGKDGMHDKYLSKNITKPHPHGGHLKPNHLSTYDYLIKAKKDKNEELTEKMN
jgi:hypothetical protein